MSEEIPDACQKGPKDSYPDYHRLGIDLSVLSFRVAELDQKVEDFRIADDLAEREAF